MSEIKRYRPDGGYDQGGLTYGCMEEDRDGEYVKWEDVVDLIVEYDSALEGMVRTMTALRAKINSTLSI